MLFEDDRDWKDYLNPEAQQKLAQIFEAAKVHRGAYMNAQDVKIAQLWCAIIEMNKELRMIRERLEAVSEPFKAIARVGQAEKRAAIAKLISELIKPTEEETNEATKRLVESLMRF